MVDSVLEFLLVNMTTSQLDSNPIRVNARRRVAISQSNYIPWRGYFDMIASVDEFVFYDDVQYTTRDWRNRNKIKTPRGTQWLTVPVGRDWHRKICEVMVLNPACGREHWTILHANYARAPYFKEVAVWLKPFYSENWTSLSELNQHLTAAICSYLGIGTKLSRSSDYGGEGDRNGRLIALCKQAGADIYVSGPKAGAYLDIDTFERSDIEVSWMDYSGYREYPQLWGAFEPQVSIVDLLFNCGPNSRQWLKFGS